MTFAQWVATTRRSLGLSQAECAEKAGVSTPVWHEYENTEKKAQPRRATVMKIAEALGVPATDALMAAGYSVEAMSAEIPTEWRATLDKMMRLPAEKRERVRKAVDHMLEAAF